MVNSKIDIKTVSVILGHSDVAITMNLYVHPDQNCKREAIDKSMKNLF